jgi:hypothetical protein
LEILIFSINQHVTLRLLLKIVKYSAPFERLYKQMIFEALKDKSFSSTWLFILGSVLRYEGHNRYDDIFMSR